MGIKENKCGKITSLTSSKYYLSLKTPDNYCFAEPGFGLRITGFLKQNDKILISGKRLQNCTSYFSEPCDSLSSFSIFISDSESPLEEIFEENGVIFKLICLPSGSSFLYIPILHTRAD